MSGRDRAFYTVANARHFIGAVALLNSLRMLGHQEPFRLVDCGLTEDQRSRLRPHAELVPAPEGVAPVHLAPYGPRLLPADVQLVLDADIIATRPLHDLFASASEGRVVGFVNDPPNHERFFPAWGPALGLGELRPGRPYLNAGYLAFARTMNDRLIPRWIDGQARLGLTGSRYERARLTDPFYFADQDVLNAVLAHVVADDELDVRPYTMAPHPPFRGVRLAGPGDAATERPFCVRDDGEPPYFLHHTMAKPWLQATRSNVYGALLTRLLLADDVALRLRSDELPLRLRQGTIASVDRCRASVVAVTRGGVRRQLGVLGIRTRLEDRRRTRATR